MKFSILKNTKTIVIGTIFSAVLGFTSIAQATVLKITVTNNAEVNGLTFTPVYTAFHSAAYDAFNVGSTASAGLKSLAELGMGGGLAAERTAVDPNSVGGMIFPDGGMRPLFPGEMGSMEFNITDPSSNMYFTFLSMILPSNDTFFGRDDALQIFDGAGVFLGNRTINVTGADLWDAGTEALNIAAAPFAPGSTPGDNPVDANTSIRAAESLAAFAGLTLPNGQTLDANLIDFLLNPAAFNVASITIEEVPEPAVASILLLGLAGLRLVKRK